MNHSMHLKPEKKLPTDFTIVAIMTAYNEEDIISHSLTNLINQGIDVYLIDNWSTDNTYNIAKQFEGKGLIGIEKFPQDGPAPYYSWKSLLARVEQLSQEIKANWFMHHDVDEIRRSPWDNVCLKDAIYAVDLAGFNAIDFTVIEFHPTDNHYTTGSDFEEYFKYFDFGKHPAHFTEIKAWKNLGQNIQLVDSGGHEVKFNGRKVYPYKFLLKHYPIRSQKHGEKKVFLERKKRYDPQEKKIGWHTHYDNLNNGHTFLRSKSELIFFDKNHFNIEYLIERLSGIGVIQNLTNFMYMHGTKEYLPLLLKQKYLHDLMRIYHARSDLMAAFPEAETSNNLLNLFAWAGQYGVIEHIELQIHAPVYVLMWLYKERLDLQISFPNISNFTELCNLFCWANDFGINEDSRLKPYSDFYKKYCKLETN